MKIGRNQKNRITRSQLWKFDLIIAIGTLIWLGICVGLSLLMTSKWAIVFFYSLGFLAFSVIVLYVLFRPFLKRFEYRLRGCGDYKYDIFISYRHKQHNHFVESIYNLLKDRGFTVWLDKKGGVKPNSWGLLLSLVKGLRDSRSVVFLVPGDNDIQNNTEKSSLMERLEELLMKLKQSCGQPVESIIDIWHHSCYEIALRKKPTESWQQWEGRVALETQVPLFFTVTTDAENGIDTSFNDLITKLHGKQTQHHSLEYQCEQLEQDFIKPIEKNIRMPSNAKRELPFKNDGEKFFGLALIAFCFLMFVASLHELFNSIFTLIKDLFTWIFSRISNLIHQSKLNDDP